MSLHDEGLAGALVEAAKNAKQKSPVELLTRELTADLVNTIIAAAKAGKPVEELYAEIDLRHALFLESLDPYLKE